jgi:hypothetical protein
MPITVMRNPGPMDSGRVISAPCEFDAPAGVKVADNLETSGTAA